MKFYKSTLTILLTVPAFAERRLSESTSKTRSAYKEVASYEVWGSDQSNSVAGASGRGTKGSYLWIWDSESIDDQLSGSKDAVPLSCTPDRSSGPCNVLDVFPNNLKEYDIDIVSTGKKLADVDRFGRLHGMIGDPFGKYVTANLFVPGGGYVGIIDTDTKGAVALFRLTELYYSSGDTAGRSNHLSWWTADGLAIIVANLHGRAIERIDIERDDEHTITAAVFNTNATLGLGKNMSVKSPASFFLGNNVFGTPLVGSINGRYGLADLGDLTPNGECKESGCSAGKEISGGYRPVNVPIYAFASTNDNAYVTLGGGGMFIARVDTTPMSIVAEYGNEIVNGAGVVAQQVGKKVFVNGGVSASGAGATQSTFTVYAFEDEMYSHTAHSPNSPMPTEVFKDAGNTNTIGNKDGYKDKDTSGQIPGITTRRDAHGMYGTKNGKYLHMVDRIQGVVEVFDTETYKRRTYDLVSIDGKSGREGPPGPCLARSVFDDPNLVLNDPAPDLFEITPDGKYFMVAFRGPAPVSVAHSAQGSCPGVGIIKIVKEGKSGYLVDVLRSSNTVDDAAGATPGGIDYAGAERSDIHYAIVISKGS